MSGTALTRRRFLARLAAAGGLAAAGTLAGCGAPRTDLGAVARSRQGLVFAAAVGEAYVRSRPAEAGRRELEKRLWRELGWRARSLEPAEVDERLRQRVAEELASGERLVEVEGWWLAPTEARLAALAWLADPERAAAPPG